ncbi:MAG: acylphosphatase [Archaeoglobaceae archaeon]
MGLKISIKGKVHDVGYRLFLLEEADSLFIPYFDARNVKIDGKEVLIVFLDGEKEQMEQFVELVKTKKPEMAIVEDISIEEFKGRVREIDKFRASLNTAQLSKIVQVGIKMVEKQDTMLEKMDLMLQKQDEMKEELGGKIDRVSEKLDIVAEKVDKVAEKVDQVSEKLDIVAEKVDKVAEKVDQVSEKLDIVAEKVDKVAEGVQETNTKLEMLRSDFRDYMEIKMRELNDRISRIEDALKRTGLM